MPRRGLTVLAAVAFGAVASAAAHSEATSTQQKAFKNSKLESVYVLKGIVPRDESGAAAASQGLLEKTQMPSQFVPVGAVTDLSAIAARVAGSDLPTGEVVVGGMFVSAADNPGAAAGLLPRGEVAVTVSVSQAQGVAGLIQPGDRVDILLDLPGAQEATLYRSVAVLAVGTALQPPPGVAAGAVRTTATAPSGSESQANAVAAATELITFAVSPAAAAHIAPAKSDSGGVVPGVYLALDAPGNAPASESTITIPGSGIVPGAATGSPAVTTTTTTLHKATPPSQGGGPGAPTP
ncbi:MAG TPA: Flp pilus assembly protein CpaB [Acidimicrobiales bacterium]|nr:Flp pilus assembly protein CpaB [Acidimicrobiales bacterium]